jgi:CheY-like chemotaxis protein
VYAVHKREVAVVLLDMLMPVMGGQMTARSLARLNPEVRILESSGLASGPRLEAVSAGRRAYLGKPYTAHELLSAIGALCKER